MSPIYRFLREKLFFSPIPRQLNNKTKYEDGFRGKVLIAITNPFKAAVEEVS